MTEPLSVAVLGSDIFWTNQKSHRIYWADKHNDAYSFNKKINLGKIIKKLKPTTPN